MILGRTYPRPNFFGVTSALMKSAAVVAVVILLGLIPAWIAQRKDSGPFWLWWLLGTAAFGIILPLAAVVPKPGQRDPMESRRFMLGWMAAVTTVNAVVIIGGWELSGL